MPVSMSCGRIAFVRSIGTIAVQTRRSTCGSTQSERKREGTHLLTRLQAVGQVLQRRLDRGEQPQDVQVQRDLPQYARPLHLHRHVRPVLQRAPAHLPDGCRRDRLVRERREHLAQVRRAQLAVEHVARRVAVEGGDRVLELAQLQRVGLREDVSPDAQRLALRGISTLRM